MDNPELSGNRVRVIFRLEPSDMHDHSIETLWAVPLRDIQFRIENVPFFIFGVSTGDVVLAKPREERYEYVRTVTKGGHSTYRIFVTKSASAQDFKARWKQLTALGCSKESDGPYFHAVDVPPETDIYAVYELLERGEHDNVWVFEEGDCGHIS